MVLPRPLVRCVPRRVGAWLQWCLAGPQPVAPRRGSQPPELRRFLTRYHLDASFPGRKIMGETPAEVGRDTMWDDRIWVQILYRLTTMFHVLHQGLGPKLELTANPAWGEHCRKEALAHAAPV